MKNLITLLIVLFSLSGVSQSSTDTLGHDGINISLLDSLVEVYVNELRVNRGINILEFNVGVKEHSYNHSNWLVKNNKFEHSTGIIGECILICGVWGISTYEEAAKALLSVWVKSLPHKRALLSGYYKFGGCGTVVVDYNYGCYGVKSSFGLSPIDTDNL